jgi:hypothetical protein
MLALQVWGPEFKPLYCQKKKKVRVCVCVCFRNEDGNGVKEPSY